MMIKISAKKLGISLITAGVAVIAYISIQFLNAGSSSVDSQVIEEFRNELNKAAKEGKLVASPTVAYIESPRQPYTRVDFLADVENLINGSKDGSQDYNHLALMAAEKYFDEFTPDEQKKIRPYLLPPTAPGSYFNVSNWKSSDDKFSTLLNNFIPIANADLFVDIDYFNDNTSGYEYVQNGNVKVYYPGESLIPSGIDIPPNEDGEAPAGDVNVEFLRTIAQGVLAGAVEAYPKYEEFLGVSGPPLAVFYIVQDLNVGGTGAGGFTTSCEKMYISFDAIPDSTASHELFHCFQDITGIAGLPATFDAWLNLLSEDAGVQKWMVEGGATVAEHVANVARNSEHRWFQQYVQIPNKTLFTRSYAAALFWFELLDIYGEDVVSSQMLAYAGNFDNVQQAEMAGGKLHQIALDVSGNDDLYESGYATRPYDYGEILLEPTYSSSSLSSDGPAAIPLNIGKMAMQFYDLDMAGEEVDYVYFNFGKDIDEDDFEISVLVYGDYDTYKKLDLKIDDQGNRYFMLCATDNKICEEAGEQFFDGMYSVFLVITNSSGIREYGGDFTATIFGPDKYKAYKVVMNEGELTVPVGGRLTLNINSDEAEMKMKANRFWMPFSNEFYGWEAIDVPQSPNVGSVNIHPTRFTGYVNNFCSFRGFVNFDFELKSEETEGIWIKRVFKLKKGDQGNFHITPHKFVCRMDPEMVRLLGISGPALIVLQAMFAKINTEDYGSDSFAGQLHRIFKEFMTLGLKDDEEGEIEMYFTQEDDFETIKIEFNDKLHLYLFKAE